MMRKLSLYELWLKWCDIAYDEKTIYDLWLNV